MPEDKHNENAPKPWTHHAARALETSESAVLVLIGIALALVAVLLLYAGMSDLNTALHQGAAGIEMQAIGILNTVLLVMMTMEIVYTVAISLESHVLNAEPFLIIGVIAAIRRMLVITATSTQQEGVPGQFYNTLVELGLLAVTVVALAIAIWILRLSLHKYVKVQSPRTANSAPPIDHSGRPSPLSSFFSWPALPREFDPHTSSSK